MSPQGGIQWSRDECEGEGKDGDDDDGFRNVMSCLVSAICMQSKRNPSAFSGRGRNERNARKGEAGQSMDQRESPGCGCIYTEKWKGECIGTYIQYMRGDEVIMGRGA